jgi:hypothetical protein
MPFNGEIQDQWDIDQIEKFIRAMYHPPYTGATYQGQLVESVDQYIILKSKLNED